MHFHMPSHLAIDGSAYRRAGVAGKARLLGEGRKDQLHRREKRLVRFFLIQPNDLAPERDDMLDQQARQRVAA